ncbi:hypothetical protein HDV57DRAFT_41682 [Trichoderma longibrachiatum]
MILHSNWGDLSTFPFRHAFPGVTPLHSTTSLYSTALSSTSTHPPSQVQRYHGIEVAGTSTSLHTRTVIVTSNPAQQKPYSLMQQATNATGSNHLPTSRARQPANRVSQIHSRTSRTSLSSSRLLSSFMAFYLAGKQLPCLRTVKPCKASNIGHHNRGCGLHLQATSFCFPCHGKRHRLLERGVKHDVLLPPKCFVTNWKMLVLGIIGKTRDLR